MTYAEFIEDLLVAIDNRNDRVEPFLRRQTVESLQRLSNREHRWMQATLEFETVSGQAEYGVGHAGFPNDIGRIKTLYRRVVDAGTAHSGNIVLQLITISEMREAQQQPMYDSCSAPTVWAWHAEQLVLGPHVGEIVTIYGDYQKDGRRDVNSGALIATNSTTATNGWFDEGLPVLRSHVLWNYYLHIAKDPEAATYQQGLHADALGDLDAASKQFTLVAQPADFYL